MVCEDKYEKELEIAKANARSIPPELVDWIGCLLPVGTEETKYGNYYYYKDKESGTYYYDSDSAKRFRQQFREHKQKRFTKK